MEGLRIQDLRRPGLSGIDLAVGPGEIVALHGPSGSGKTLLLRAIADLDPNRGRVSLDGVARDSLAAHQWRARVAYLPPESHWWAARVAPHAPHWPGEWLEALGFGPEVLDWEVARLSSGERQRLSLLRTLARRPRALLLDEPTANLDPANTRAVEALIADYLRTQHCPVLWVSHDPAQRERMAERQHRMQAGGLQ